MKILLLGKNGQVGWELQRSLAPLGEVVALGRHGTGENAELCGDFTNPEGVVAAVRAVHPDVIVNAVAHTAVDKAESEPELAHQLNAIVPGLLAEEAVRLKALLVHYSTDYVFDGSGDAPWQEGDATGPLSVYGRTKLEGEQRIREAGGAHLILRTSWVYAARGGNFAKTMLRLAQERDSLSVIDDQWGAPTGADLLADVTAHAIRHLRLHPQDGGLYQCVAGGETTWNAYARFVIEQARQIRPELAIKASEVRAVPTSAFPTPARRPHNSRLDTHKLQTTFGLHLPHWQPGVVRTLHEML